MSKQIFPLIIIATTSILLAGCTNKNTPDNTPEGQTISNPTEVIEAIQTGKSTICTMVKGEEVWEYTVDGKMLRVNSKTFHNDQSGKRVATIGRLINDGKYVYKWDADTKKGSKVAIPTEEEVKFSAKKAQNYPKRSPSAPNFESEADYETFKNEGYTIDCKLGTIDQSIFEVPSDIRFIDTAALINSLPSPGPDGQVDEASLKEAEKKYVEDFKKN